MASTSQPHGWPSFSAASLRRLLLNSMSCGRHRTPASLPKQKSLPPPNKQGSSAIRLSDLLRTVSSSSSGRSSASDKMEVFEELCKVVKRLQFGEDMEKKKHAAADVRRLAKDDADVRETLAMLGAIPALVGLLDMHWSLELDFQTHVLYALLNLGIGNDMNKAATVKAGAIDKMIKMIKSHTFGINPLSAILSEAIAANFLGLSALDANKHIIGSSGAISLLSGILTDSATTPQAKQDALKAVFNLSIVPSNVPIIVDTDIIPFLMTSIGDMNVSQRALSILSNVVATPEGRMAIAGAHHEAYAILVDVLGWSDSSVCQEKAAYILMILAHKNMSDRPVMVEAGAVSAALELTLLGSTLTQKRASRILECLTEGNQASGQVGLAISEPLMAVFPATKDNESQAEVAVMSQESRALQELVQQSLHNNMRDG